MDTLEEHEEVEFISYLKYLATRQDAVLTYIELSSILHEGYIIHISSCLDVYLEEMHAFISMRWAASGIATMVWAQSGHCVAIAQALIQDNGSERSVRLSYKFRGRKASHAHGGMSRS